MYIRADESIGFWSIPPIQGVDIDFKKAVRLNRYYRKELGWDKEYPLILKLLGYSTTKPPDEESFAQQVAFWQRSVGFKDKDIDGIIGKGTWERMRAAIKARAEAEKSQPATAPSLAPPVRKPSPVYSPFEIFPLIRQYRPEEYQNALKAYDDFQEVKLFAPYFYKLSQAAMNAELKLDYQGNVVITVQRQNLLDLLAKEAANQLIEEIKPPQIVVFGEKVATVLGILEQLNTIYQSIRNEELVGKVGKEWDRKRYIKKLSLVMDVMATDLAKQKRTYPGAMKTWLVHQYFRFLPRFENYQKYKFMEDSFNPRIPSYPTIGPAKI